MKAVVLDRFGGPDVLCYRDVPSPTPGAGDVVIAVRGVTVNRTLDLAVRAGLYARRPALPHVLGADPVGTVVRTGPGVGDVAIGERVAVSPIVSAASADRPAELLGVDRWGGYAQEVRVPADRVYRLPEGLGWADAAITARHAPLAIHLLRTKAALRAGETVLVMGATGGLGSAGIQVGKWLGARVLGAAGSRDRAMRAQAHGAEIAVDYRTERLSDWVMEHTGGRGVDVVFENIGDPVLFPEAVASLARSGRLVTAGAHAGGIVPLDLTRVYQRQLSLYGSTRQSDDDVVTALELASRGVLVPDVARVLPLADAATAHALIESGQVAGKIVLVPELV